MPSNHARSRAADNSPIPVKPPLDCPDCTGELRLQRAKYGLAYMCENWPACKGAHGAHPDGTPMGTPASADVRVARMRAHAAFDALWLDADQMPCYSPNNDGERGYIRKVARTRAYRWLENQMGLTREDCHIGDFGIEQCDKVVRICRGVGPEVVRAWLKGRQKQAAA